MSDIQLVQLYVRTVFGTLLERVRRDERGYTAEQIVAIAVAVVSAAIVAGIIWNKMTAGANSIPTPGP